MVAAMMLDSETARIRAVLINNGTHSLTEADAKLAASELSIFIGDDVAETTAGQAAFLTAIATAARCFGKVPVSGALDRPLILPLPIAADTLAEGAALLGGTVDSQGPSRPSVIMGSRSSEAPGWQIHLYCDGWIAGIAPRSRPFGCGECALAGVAAGALAVGHAFRNELGDPRAGRDEQRLSMWSPEMPPTDAENPSLSDISFPRSLWLIVLGNLGQAYLWSLFMLPYAEPKKVLLY